MSKETGTARVKRGMAEMLKGGVIMDVVNVEQAKIEMLAWIGLSLKPYMQRAMLPRILRS